MPKEHQKRIKRSSDGLVILSSPNSIPSAISNLLKPNTKSSSKLHIGSNTYYDINDDANQNLNQGRRGSLLNKNIVIPIDFHENILDKNTESRTKDLSSLSDIDISSLSLEPSSLRASGSSLEIPEPRRQRSQRDKYHSHRSPQTTTTSSSSSSSFSFPSSKASSIPLATISLHQTVHRKLSRDGSQNQTPLDRVPSNHSGQLSHMSLRKRRMNNLSFALHLISLGCPKLEIEERHQLALSSLSDSSGDAAIISTPPSIFPFLSSLTELDLSHNRLSGLPSVLFTAAPSIK